MSILRTQVPGLWAERAGSNYLAVLTLAVPASVITLYFLRLDTFAGFAPRMLVSIGLVSLSVLFAIFFAPPGSASPLWIAAAISGIAAWLVLMLIMRIGGSGVEYSVLILPVFLLLTVLRPVDLRAVNNAIAALVLGTGLIVLSSELSALLFGRPEWTQFYAVVGARWELAQVSLGLSNSWQGPFNWPADAGIGGAFLVTYGLAARARIRWLALALGALMILAAQRYTPLFGVVVALAVVLWFSRNSTLRWSVKPLRLLLAFALLFSAALFVLRYDPSLNGRNLWWSACRQLWLENPVLGYQSVESGVSLAESFRCDYAHALGLQVLTEFGIVGTIAVFTFVGIGVLICLRAARAGDVLGLSITAAFLVMGLAETHGSWLYLNLPWVWLILGILHSASFLETRSTTSRNSSKTE